MSVPLAPGRPLWGYCLIRPENQVKKTPGGIELPDGAPNGNTHTGIILAKGSGSLAFDGSPIPMEVEPGAKVIYLKNQAEEVTLENEKLDLVDQRAIIYVYYK